MISSYGKKIAILRAKTPMKAHRFNEEMGVTAHEFGEYQQAFVVPDAVFGPRSGIHPLVAALINIDNQLKTLNDTINKRFDALDKPLDAIDQGLDSSICRSTNMEARQMNVVARDHEDPIRVITGPSGLIPPAVLFPNKYAK
jgi:hypothetical protein